MFLAALDDDGVKKWRMERLPGHRYVAGENSPLLNRSGSNWPHCSSRGSSRSSSSNADSNNQWWTSWCVSRTNTNISQRPIPPLHLLLSLEGSRSLLKAMFLLLRQGANPQLDQNGKSFLVQKMWQNIWCWSDGWWKTFLINLYDSVHCYAGVYSESMIAVM